MRQNIASVVSSPISHERKQAFITIGIQAIVAAMVALLWLCFKSPISAMGAVLGGLACLIPGMLYTAAVFATAKVRTARRVAFALFAGEFAKIIASALAIAAVLIYLPYLLWPTLAGFLGAQFGAWLAPLFRKKRS